jgi:hypothetical protein
MIRTLIVAPYVGLVAAVVAQLLLVLRQIWFPDGFPAQQGGKAWQFLVYCARNFWMTLLLMVGVVCIDVGFLWVLGGWGFAFWRYHLPQVLFAVIVGLELVAGIVLVRPTPKKTRFFVAMVAMFWVAFRLLVPLVDNLIYAVGGALGGLLVVFWAIGFFGKVFVVTADDDVPASLQRWDKVQQYRRWFGWPVQVGILAGAFITTLLMAYGYTFLSF